MIPAKLMLVIDRRTRNRLKAKVALEGTTIKEVITKMVEQYLMAGAKEGTCPEPRGTRKKS